MHKKKIILTIITIILFIICIVLAYFVIEKYSYTKCLEEEMEFAEKNKEPVFKIEEITMFSSADAKNKASTKSSYTIENLYQYTDIAIFIKNDEEKTLKNTFKKVYIDNIQFYDGPEVGSPALYFKSINNFAKSEIIDENKIDEKIEFNVTSEDEANLDTPTLYNNLANPITLSYINEEIKTDYTIADTSSPITYDGSLLKKSLIPLTTIKAKLSFDIYITNNLDQEFKSTVFIEIPLENETEDGETETIYNGNIKTTKKVNYTFIRYN